MDGAQLSEIRIDPKAVEAAGFQLSQSQKSIGRVSSSLPYTNYQVNYAIAARKNIQSRMSRSEQRVRELSQKIDGMNTFIHTTLGKYNGLERELAQKAQAISGQGGLPPASSCPVPTSNSKVEADTKAIKVISHIAKATIDWMKDLFKDNSSSTEKMPIYASVGAGDGSMLRPSNPDTYTNEDLLNMDDPEAYERLMNGPFGRMTEEERKELIAKAKEEERRQRLADLVYDQALGQGFADGLGKGIESVIEGMIGGAKAVAQNPFKAIGNAVESFVEKITNPKETLVNNFEETVATAKDFWYGNDVRKGYYVGFMFTDLVFSIATGGSGKVLGFVSKLDGGSGSDRKSGSGSNNNDNGNDSNNDNESGSNNDNDNDKQKLDKSNTGDKSNEGFGNLSQTEPSLPNGGKPKGNYTKGDSHGIKKESQTADLLADQGYDIKMLDEVNGGNGYGLKESSNPDFLIEGNVFDCYAPTIETKVDNILRNITTKTKTQAERIVLNLDQFPPEKVIEIIQGILRKANPNGDLKNLKELLIVKDGKITRAFGG
ncbi:hypothetical protein ACFQZE_10800 [Paenibacillus sp. GCM10027627]|uniref:CdiA C-terminal domain-containing protein n=1 Tax=unclassified Paenibacillus TaxID=185978 RepID=UPI003636096D